MKRNIYIIWLLIGLFGMGEASLFYGCGGVTETGNPESVEPSDEPVPGEEGLPSSLICEILEGIRKSYPVTEGSPSTKKVEKFHPTADTTPEDIRKVSTYTRFCDPDKEVEWGTDYEEQVVSITKDITAEMNDSANAENLRSHLEFLVEVYVSKKSQQLTLQDRTEEKIVLALDKISQLLPELSSEIFATWALAVLVAELTPRYPEIFEDIENADREQILEFFKNL